MPDMTVLLLSLTQVMFAGLEAHGPIHKEGRGPQEDIYQGNALQALTSCSSKTLSTPCKAGSLHVQCFLH